MDRVNVVATLQTAFPDMEPVDVEEIASLVTLKTYPPNTLICRENAYENTFYLIVEGEVAITKHFEGSEERVLRYTGAGDFFGEMALIQDEPRSANVRTTRETLVLEFERDAFRQLIASTPELTWRLVRVTFDRLRSNDQAALEDLRQTYHTLEQIDHAKSDFIEVVAHELRTPLTVIQGYADVLRNHPAIQADPELSEVIGGITRGTMRLYEIVNGMLDISRLDTDTMNVSRVPVLVQSVLNELKNSLSDALEQRNLTLDIVPLEDVPFIEGDPGLIQKAFYQLLTNAIKYTPDGGTITVSCWLTDVEGMGPAVAVVFQDSGIGIDPEYHTVIFEKFYQIGEVALHSSGRTSFKGGGPGLGLALVKGVIEAHGGMVWVESEGCDETTLPGSTFNVLLPVDGPLPASAS